jgi:hypothetical protein
MNNLANQLQLMLRQIQRAGDNSSSTDSVRWYTIPTDTEMPKADVTFDTIGFIGDAGAGATFKLYYNSNGTGSKTYHVYFKQLAGTGKLTLTTGVGAVDLVVSVGTYVMIIYVDENGNISTQGSTPVNTVTAGNTQPVTSGAVSSAIGALDDWHEAWSGNLTIPYTDGVGQILTVPAIKNSRQVAVLINGTAARGPSRIVLDNVSGTGDSFQTYIGSVNSYYLTIAFQVSFSSGEIKATCYSGGWSFTPSLVKVLYR